MLHAAVDSRTPKIGSFGIGLAVMVAILADGPLLGGGRVGFVYEKFIMEKK